MGRRRPPPLPFERLSPRAGQAVTAYEGPPNLESEYCKDPSNPSYPESDDPKSRKERAPYATNRRPSRGFPAPEKPDTWPFQRSPAPQSLLSAALSRSSR